MLDHPDQAFDWTAKTVAGRDTAQQTRGSVLLTYPRVHASAPVPRTGFQQRLPHATNAVRIV